MAQLVKADGSFSLVGEAGYRRFGDSPLMDRYLADLATAQAPRAAAKIEAEQPS